MRISSGAVVLSVLDVWELRQDVTCRHCGCAFSSYRYLVLHLHRDHDSVGVREVVRQVHEMASHVGSEYENNIL